MKADCTKTRIGEDRGNQTHIEIERIIRECISNEPESGILWWAKKPKRNIIENTRVKTFIRRGYEYTTILGVFIRVHRIIWLIHNGSWPLLNIDHINGNPLDNRLSNLRDVSQKINAQNVRRMKNNPHGLMGVTIKKGRIKRPWRAQIRVDGRFVFLGAFKTKEEAYSAYIAAKKIHHPWFIPPDQAIPSTQIPTDAEVTAAMESR